jgi:TPR repeat protein
MHHGSRYDRSPFALQAYKHLTIPSDPVETEDGQIYQKNALEEFIASNNVKIAYHRSKRIKQIIDHVLASGEVEAQYITTRKDEHKGSSACNSGPSTVETIEEIKSKAAAGDTKYMVRLGELYLTGEVGLEKDPEEGFTWFNRAADKGDDLGAARRADCLLTGKFLCDYQLVEWRSDRVKITQRQL